MLPPYRGQFGITRSVRLSVPWRSCRGYRHAGCLQLSRPPEVYGLRTHPRTDVDPPRFLDRTAIGGGISSRRPWGDTVFELSDARAHTQWHRQDFVTGGSEVWGRGSRVRSPPVPVVLSVYQRVSLLDGLAMYLQCICRVIRKSSMTMKAHTYYIIFGRPPIGGKLLPFPLAAPLHIRFTWGMALLYLYL